MHRKIIENFLQLKNGHIFLTLRLGGVSIPATHMYKVSLVQDPGVLGSNPFQGSNTVARGFLAELLGAGLVGTEESPG